MSRGRSQFNRRSRHRREQRRKAVQIAQGVLVVAQVAREAQRLVKAARADLSRQFQITEMHGSTIVELDHVDGNYRFTTSGEFLPRAQFGSLKAVKHINEKLRHRAGGVKKGRVIFCIDLTRREVMAAIAYHLPRNTRDPLLITAFAVRSESESLKDESLSMTFLTKRYLHALARRLRRESFVDFVADDRTLGMDLGLLGFVPPPDIGSDGEEWRFRQFET